MDRIDPDISIPRDTQRLIVRTRVIAVLAFALALAAASALERREPMPAERPRPAMLARMR